MNQQPKPNKIPSLFEVEMETLEEGREWTRRRLEQKLQKLAKQQGAISPPQRPETEERQDASGDDPDLRRGITLEAPYGQEPDEEGAWLSPVRELWNLAAHQT